MEAYESPWAYQDEDWMTDPCYCRLAESYTLHTDRYEPFGTLQMYVGAVYFKTYEDALRKAIDNGEINIRRRTKRVPRPTEFHLNACTMKFVEPYRTYLNTKPTVFMLDVVMIANIDIRQKLPENPEFFVTSIEKETGKSIDTVTQWFRISGQFDLYHRENDLIQSIRIYDPQDRVREGALFDCLTPVLSKKELEGEAGRILRKYGMRDISGPLDPMALAGKMGLKVIYARLSRGYRVKAKLFLEPSDAEIINELDCEETIRVQGGTILVDPAACRTQEAIQEAILHECVHAEEHWLYLTFQRMYHDQITYVAMTDRNIRAAYADDIYAPGEEESRALTWPAPGNAHTLTELDWAELQTRMITARIQMPEAAARAMIAETYELQKSIYGRRSTACEKTIPEVAAYFGVSAETARHRMIDLGYRDARWVLHQVDGRTLRPYTTSDGAYIEGTTYDIGLPRVNEMYERDPRFRRVMDEYPIVWVEGHLCLNDAKYVRDSGNGLELTDYARIHIEECCMLFLLDYEGEILPIDYDALHYDIENDNPYSFKMAMLPLAVRMKEQAKFQKICEGLPATFSETLKKYRTDFKLSQAALAERIDVDMNTYSKYEHLRKPHITKQIIARIGHELRLRGELTEDLMAKAGFTLDVMDFKDSVLRMVIYEYVDEPIEKINQLMNQYGCLPLGSRKQVA